MPENSYYPNLVVHNVCSYLSIYLEKNDVVALCSLRRYVTHQYKQVKNGVTETMWLILMSMFFLDEGLELRVE